MKNKSKIFILAATVAAAMSASPAQAQNLSFDKDAGDIVLYALKFGGSQTLVLNIGTGQSFRDAGSSLFNIKNIGTELAAISGQANWWEDGNLYWGIAGVRSSSTGTTAQLFGDPSRTLYLSKERTAIGTVGLASSVNFADPGNTNMTTAANNIIAQNNRLETIGTTDRLVEGTGSSVVDNANSNPFLGSNPGTAFSVFPGGVIGNFGVGAFGTLDGVNAEGALDLYRILAANTASGQEPGPLRTGSYEGSFVIDQSGDVSFIAVPEPSSAVLFGSAALLGGFIRRRKSVA